MSLKTSLANVHGNMKRAFLCGHCLCLQPLVMEFRVGVNLVLDVDHVTWVVCGFAGMDRDWHGPCSWEA